jgi:hypothetical protein
MYIFTENNANNVSPKSPPVMINVNQCMAGEIFLYFTGGAKKKLRTTGTEGGVLPGTGLSIR